MYWSAGNSHNYSGERMASCTEITVNVQVKSNVPNNINVCMCIYPCSDSVYLTLTLSRRHRSSRT